MALTFRVPSILAGVLGIQPVEFPQQFFALFINDFGRDDIHLDQQVPGGTLAQGRHASFLQSEYLPGRRSRGDLQPGGTGESGDFSPVAEDGLGDGYGYFDPEVRTDPREDRIGRDVRLDKKVSRLTAARAGLAFPSKPDSRSRIDARRYRDVDGLAGFVGATPSTRSTNLAGIAPLPHRRGGAGKGKGPSRQPRLAGPAACPQGLGRDGGVRPSPLQALQVTVWLMVRRVFFPE